MTENEAIKELETSINLAKMCTHNYERKREIQGYEMAINALEEVQQYRAIGTVEECQKSVEICKSMIERNITPENMEEYMKFEDECVKDGFTFNSLLEAREKQTAKKIEIFNGQASCPNCKYLFGGMDVIKKLITWDMPHCKNCGQLLDWRNEAMTKKYCSTCKWYNTDDGICCNGYSEYRADFRTLDDTCEKWEENEE